ncbi:MAG: tetratricopeptide repeat protein [bacterium]
MTSDPKSNLNENDPLQLFVKKTLLFLSTYKIYLICSSVTIVVLAIGSFLYFQNQEKLLAATKKYLVNANNQFQKEKYNESAKSFLDAISTSPNKNITNRAKLGLSNVYKSQKKYNEAIEILNSAWSDIKNYKEEKNSIEYELIFRSLISIHMKNKNCAEISKLITREFKITKKDDLFLELGRCYTNAGKTEKSLEVFKELLKKYPKSPFVTNQIKLLKSTGKI